MQVDYAVIATVYRDGKEVDKGMFQNCTKLGHWLDDVGYNREGYEVRLTFVG